MVVGIKLRTGRADIIHREGTYRCAHAIIREFRFYPEIQRNSRHVRNGINLTWLIRVVDTRIGCVHHPEILCRLCRIGIHEVLSARERYPRDGGHAKSGAESLAKLGEARRYVEIFFNVRDRAFKSGAWSTRLVIAWWRGTTGIFGMDAQEWRRVMTNSETHSIILPLV